MSAPPQQGRLKKFTHAKIAEQLAKRKDIIGYDKVLMKCKVSEDAIGIVLDTSSPSWKQLQVMVLQHDKKNQDQQATVLTTSHSDRPVGTVPQNAPTLTTAASVDRPSTPTQLNRSPSSRSNASASGKKIGNQPPTPQKARPIFKPLVFPRCPVDSVKALCQELFVLKEGYQGSIFRDDFIPERIASQPDPISPFHNLPSHIALSPQISVSAVRKACLHNGIACIPSCLRGLVWAVLLDLDISALGALPTSQSQVPSSPSSPTASADASSQPPQKSFNPQPASSPQLSRSATSARSSLRTAQEFMDKYSVSDEPEDPSLPPVSGLSVIKVDLHRTYPHLDIFSMPQVQQIMEKLLVKSCRVADLEYKQGLNYLLATLMLVWMPLFSKYSTEDLIQPVSTPQSPASPSGDISTTSSHASHTSEVDPEKSKSGIQQAHEKHMQYQLEREGEIHQQTKYQHAPDILYANSSIITASLTQLIQKLLPNTYSDKDFGSLQCLFMFFRLLLQYHDPVLSYHLDFYETSPEFYAAPWFLTLHVTRTKDISIILLLWDHLLLYLRQDPMLHYFVSLGLLVDKRETLLQQQDTTLPETLSKMCLTSPQHLYTVFLFACQLRSQTPPSASRLLHQISTSPSIGSDGDEITQLTNMLSLEVGSDESLNQTLSTNRYTYKEILSQFHNSYYVNLLNKETSMVMASAGANSQLQPLNSLQQSQSTPFLFIDCRDEWSFRRGHLSAAINFPLQHLTDPGQREQLLRTISGFKSMHICIIYDGLLVPGKEGYGTVTPAQWAQHYSGYGTPANNNQQMKTLTGLISFLISEGIRYVSRVSYGWIQIHATALVLGVELVNHSPSTCPLCQNPAKYEAILKEQQKSATNINVTRQPQSNSDKSSSMHPATANSKFNTGLFGAQKSTKNAYLEENELVASPSGFSTGRNASGSQPGLFSSISRFFYNNQGSANGADNGINSFGFSQQDYDQDPSPSSQRNSNGSHSQPTYSNSPIRQADTHNGNVFDSGNADGMDIVGIGRDGVKRDRAQSRQNGQNGQNSPDPTQNLDSFIGSSDASTNKVGDYLGFGSNDKNPGGSNSFLTTNNTINTNHNNLKRLLNSAQPILTTPSLVHALMLSNLRNVSNCGLSLRQSVTICLHNLITTALDTIDPPFIPNSGYALTGLEYNYSNLEATGSRRGMGSDKTVSNLWIQGRIKTTSIAPQTASASTAVSNTSGANSTSITSPQPPPSYIGYLMQSQLSIIGIVRPLTYIGSDSTILPLNSSTPDSSLVPLPSTDSTGSDPLDDSQLFFAYDVMGHMLSTAAKGLNELFLISTGCIEVTPSFPSDSLFASTSSSSLTGGLGSGTGTENQTDKSPDTGHHEAQWIPRPVSLPSGLQSQHVMLFVPILTINTAAWVLSSLSLLIEHRNIPPEQIAVLCFTTSKEGFDTVQFSYGQMMMRLMAKETVDSTTAPIKPLLIISASLAHQEPLNKQPIFTQTPTTQRHMYNKDDEHSDIYPSIPQLFARYLQQNE